MHKIAQKVTSVALATSMLLSMFAVNTVAFADEFKDNTTVSDEVTEAPVSDDEVDALTRPTLQIPNPKIRRSKALSPLRL